MLKQKKNKKIKTVYLMKLINISLPAVTTGNV